jgi:hypothetical protein
MLKRLTPVLPTVMFLVVGCGGTSTTTPTAASTPVASTSVSPRGWTGMGAKLSDWATAHPANPGGCEEIPCYGGRIVDGGQTTNEFSGVTTTGAPAYRIDGYHQAIGDGTALAAAKAAVRRLLPSDTKVIAFWITHSTSGSCASWNLKSETLGRWFAEKKVGDARGDLGIDFFAYNSSDEPVFKPGDVSNAIISIAPAQRETNC